MLDYDASDQFRSYLLPGERVLWTGRPKQGLAFRGADLFLIPFSLVWFGFVTSIFIQTLQSPASGPPDFILMLFMALGFYFTIGRFIHDAAVRRGLHYAVTNERVLIIRGRRASKLKSLEINRLPMLELSEFSDGTGTLAFDTDDEFAWFGWRRSLNHWAPSTSNLRQFFRIDNPRKVYELIRKQS
jgi:hypothetical protein